MHRAFSLAVLLVAAATPIAAQQKPAVTSADYAKWETLGNDAALSPDGKFIAYSIRRGNGSAEAHYRAISGGDDHVIRSGTAPQFTSDSRWLLVTVLPDTAGGGGRGAGRAGRGAGGGAAAAPVRNKLEVIDLRGSSSTTFDDVQSYSVSSDGAHVALRRSGAQGRRATDVIVHDFDTNTDLTIGDVSELAWSDAGSYLALIVDADSKLGNGVQLLDTKTGALRALDASPTHYAGLAWRAHATDLAVMRAHADSAFADTAYTVIAWKDLASPKYTEAELNGSDQTTRIAPYRTPQWSEDGSVLFIGMAPREPRVVSERRSAGDLPPVRVQVWNAKDVREYHQQEVNAAQDRQRTTLAAWHVGADNRVVRLSADPYENTQIGEQGNVVLASTDAPYAAEYMSGRDVRDVFNVDLRTGERRKVLSKSPFGATLSPSGRYALYEQEGQWWSVDLQTGARANLTGKAKSAFVNMEDDHPVPERRAYGLAGFTNGEKSAIVYDRFDLWQVNLDGSSAMRLTRGREDSTVYRCVSEGGGFGGGGRGGRGGAGATARNAPCELDGNSQTIDTSKPLLLTATGEYNKKSGYARLTVGQPAQRLVWLDKQVSGLKKAEKADVYVVEEQSFAESPNLFAGGGASLNDLKEVSHTNAFQGDYAWGKQVLMDYTNRRGDKLQMMLTYPANYEPGKKYPMVVYYYEKLSQGFNQYVAPNYRNPYNTQVFSQNGYFVLRPDIVFQARNPGYSGLDCVESAVRAVESRVADIDAAHVGNMGHSWGGYQSAFYAVHNHGSFAATIAGAPLTDLVSFFGYTSGNSGLPETGHFETGQERMQVNLWQDPQAFIRNSTVFSMDSLHTPLLLEEGSIDGNVNPFQSQEVYNFGRRLGKDVVYLIYEDENHNVARPESQADYLHRQLEWFGHYLKGEPAPKWITEGETYSERQRILKAGAQGASAVQAGAPIRP